MKIINKYILLFINFINEKINIIKFNVFDYSVCKLVIIHNNVFVSPVYC